MKSGVFHPEGRSATTCWADTGETLNSGQRVGGGRFDLVDVLGEGGMGVVWLAIDRELSQRETPLFLALKFLAPHIRSDSLALALMREEVLQSRKLRHPRILSIYDWHAWPGEPPFISMEYVEGVNLSQLLGLQPGGFMAWMALAPWVKQLCDALDYAHHEQRIIHRDLKPANLMLDQKSELKLADFGLARVFTTAEEGLPERTQARGTPLYMSPQQMAGLPPHPTDDIYSLGATLYELLTSTPPFYTGENIFKQVTSSPVEPVAERLARLGYRNEIPSRVRMTIANCLQKDAGSRPQSAREAAHRLGLDLVEGAGPARKSFAPVLPKAEKPAPPPPSFSFFRVCVLLAMVTVALGHLFSSSPPVQTFANWYDNALEKALPTPQPPPPKPRFSQLRFQTEPPGATVELFSPNGTPVRSVQLGGAGAGQFTNVPAGRYRLAARLAGYHSTATNVVLMPRRPLEVALTLPPASTTAPPTNTLVLTCASPRPIQYRLWDEARKKILREETFLQQTTDQSGIREGAYFIEAGIHDLGPGTVRINQPLRIQPGPNILALNFVPGKAHFLVDQEVNVTATDHWGTSRRIDLSPWIENGKLAGYQGWQEREMAGELSYLFSLPPRFENFQTNLFIVPGATQEFRVSMVRSVSATPGHPWTNSLGMAFVWSPQPAPGFWSCATETTRSQFSLFAKVTGLATQEIISVTSSGWRPHGHTWMNPGFDQREDEPVVGVNWEEAARFCVWLTQHEKELLRRNQFYVLPSDEQWSALAGPGAYPWGNTWPPGSSDANCAGVEAVRMDWHPYWPTLSLDEHRDPWARTAPVTACTPNPSGLYHLGGNVAEWCSDWYRKDLNAPGLLQRYPLLSEDGGGQTYKILRGGSWYDHHPDELATRTRVRARPEERHDRYGFRVVLVQEATASR